MVWKTVIDQVREPRRSHMHRIWTLALLRSEVGVHLWVRRAVNVAALLTPRSTFLHTHKLSNHQGCATSPLHPSEHAQELQMASQPWQGTSDAYKSVQTAFVSPARRLWGFQYPTPNCLLSILCFPSAIVLAMFIVCLQNKTQILQKVGRYTEVKES